eukprot:1146097-Pelagomonas_calceolata.AAC.2
MPGSSSGPRLCLIIDLVIPRYACHLTALNRGAGEGTRNGLSRRVCDTGNQSGAQARVGAKLHGPLSRDT